MGARLQWIVFLAYRSSPDFLKVYLDIDASLIDRCLLLGSYLGNSPELMVLAELREVGLLPENKRLKALATISDLAVETPDADWLGMKVMARLFTDQERAAILDRVRRELIPDIDHVLSDWQQNEQGDNAEDYYQPLEEALKDYTKALERHPESCRALKVALWRVDRLRAEARYWRNHEEYLGDLPRSSGSQSAGTYLWRSPVVTSDLDSRSVFDDVDG